MRAFGPKGKPAKPAGGGPPGESTYVPPKVIPTNWE